MTAAPFLFRRFNLCAFASLGGVVRRLPEGRWGDLSAIVRGRGTTEEVCLV